MVQFTSSSFSGSESSGEVLVTLMLSAGGVSTSNITVMISLNGINATGYIMIIHFNSVATLEYYITF